MGPPAAGQIVLIPFVFSDLSRGKLRPALLIADAGREDWIACQITSNPYADALAVALTQADFAEGDLNRTSYLRPAKLFTAHRSLIQARPGALHPASLNHARDAVVAVIREAYI